AVIVGGAAAVVLIRKGGTVSIAADININIKSATSAASSFSTAGYFYDSSIQKTNLDNILSYFGVALPDDAAARSRKIMISGVKNGVVFTVHDKKIKVYSEEKSRGGAYFLPYENYEGNEVEMELNDENDSVIRFSIKK
ncbi:MAG: hypothetical protein LBM16_02990, partial [Clostridiales bacterium]|nr:hypothetical protein [Clostridiales bacterium]